MKKGLVCLLSIIFIIANGAVKYMLIFSCMRGVEYSNIQDGCNYYVGDLISPIPPFALFIGIDVFLVLYALTASYLFKNYKHSIIASVISLGLSIAAGLILAFL